MPRKKKKGPVIKKGKPCWRIGAVAERVAEKCGCKETFVRIILQSFFVVLEEIFEKNEQAEFPHFGRFYVQRKPSFVGRSIVSDEHYYPERFYIQLKHSKHLKWLLNPHIFGEQLEKLRESMKEK